MSVTYFFLVNALNTPRTTYPTNTAFTKFFISYFLYHSNKYYTWFQPHELQPPEDVCHTPPSVIRGYTNEGSVGNEHIHEGQNGPHI